MFDLPRLRGLQGWTCAAFNLDLVTSAGCCITARQGRSGGRFPLLFKCREAAVGGCGREITVHAR
jgi:hypothetical protein